MNIEIKRIKNTPYKLVITRRKDGDKIVGIFDKGKYIEWKRFTDKHKDVVFNYMAKEITKNV